MFKTDTTNSQKKLHSTVDKISTPINSLVPLFTSISCLTSDLNICWTCQRVIYN